MCNTSIIVFHFKHNKEIYYSERNSWLHLMINIDKVVNAWSLCFKIRLFKILILYINFLCTKLKTRVVMVFCGCVGVWECWMTPANGHSSPWVGQHPAVCFLAQKATVLFYSPACISNFGFIGDFCTLDLTSPTLHLTAISGWRRGMEEEDGERKSVGTIRQSRQDVQVCSALCGPVSCTHTHTQTHSVSHSHNLYGNEGRCHVN